MSNSSNEAKYFDLHTTGIGYLNRIREVKPRKGSPFMAVTVAALKGSSDSVEYTYIDCNVVGAEAEKLIRRCQDAVDADKKVLVAFRIGDVWADVFTYEKGPKQGQPGVSLKGRLLYLSWIKVDGETVHEAKPTDATPPSSSETAPSDTPASGGSEDSGPTQSDAALAEPVKPSKAPRAKKEAA